MKTEIIKFRVWDYLDSHFLTVEKENPYLFYNLGIPYNLTEIFSHCLQDEGYVRFKVEQFIGLQDKNGKDIYVGDILNSFNYPNDKYVVNWEILDYSSKFVLQSLKNLWNFGGCPKDYLIILGNIHQNPELLK
jgi:hypothetical protein